MTVQAELLSSAAKPPRILVYDVECYVNLFCVTFLDPLTGQERAFVLTPGGDPVDWDRVRRIMAGHLLISFNGNRYDVPMIYLAISGASNATLKQASDRIILNNLMPWDFERMYKLRIPKLNHIDIIDVAPGMVSLKLYGARLHVPWLQDLPFPPDAVLTPEQIELILKYNINDLHATWTLYLALVKQIELRVSMRDQAGIDLRSKKDAQVAAAVLKHQITKIDGREPERPAIRPGTSFKYDIPDGDMFDFVTPEMRQVMADIAAAVFMVPAEGSKLLLPKVLENRDVRIGDGVYRMGIGGLHSQESEVAHFSDHDTLLVDRDAQSFYPNMMLTFGWSARHLTATFLKVFGGIIRTRIKAKEQGNKVVADSLKLVVNSTFGLHGSKYSWMYDPKVMIQVTLTGQLLLLRLVEEAHLAGIAVISANTDGIVVKIKRSQMDAWNDIIARWERDTKIETEETIYTALYSRDVNNYVAVKPDGSVKTKGVFSETGPQKNPSNEICIRAVMDYLTKGTPVEDTINDCDDVRQFVSVRTVKGGAIYGGENGEYLGKVVRWYLAKGSDGFIRTKARDHRTDNWKTVAKTQGCRPLMTLPETLPDDLDREKYIEEAREILKAIGAERRPLEPPRVRVLKRDRLRWLALSLAA